MKKQHQHKQQTIMSYVLSSLLGGREYRFTPYTTRNIGRRYKSCSKYMPHQAAKECARRLNQQK